ncbi:hypothetical protein HUS70_01645 [Pandoraea nosoerga]|uniref:Uncharacterized protein n=1 Tax=Pandoraea nosoerga TaxID=2508296 RepID=A0A5E4RZ54_9BURK|nr:hypothetical protein [Pandoraea nosoerga]MBN4667671.1 hypothetical protein [Pandoraea nosoerga]MBN4674250.1 hypothetical protein [Pandoraea nosoerga]MBN4679519.1 hypothetical protein [Pandoraea nosoerga]MBN4743392.1 hypothetical protein [Pandoraea nosoerga]VVD68121.1 hypothetical protein PNO31109_00454 [Pandoraea nosoerga]
MGHPTQACELRPDEAGIERPDVVVAADDSSAAGLRGGAPPIDHLRGHGGTLAHVLGALGAFRSRHGHWPRHLFLYPETLAALVQDLTPLGFYLLQQRLDVVADLERDLFCVDDRGNVSIYRVQAPSGPAGTEAAAAWLGLSRPTASSRGARPPHAGLAQPPR